MASVGTVIVTIGVGVLINTTYDLQKGKSSPAVTILAGSAMAGILVIIGSTTNEWELVEAVAVLYLIGSLFAHGTQINGLNTLLGSATPPATSTAP